MLDFAGHNARQNDNWWNNTIQEWRPWGLEREQRTTSDEKGDDIRKIVGIYWKQKVQR